MVHKWLPILFIFLLGCQSSEEEVNKTPSDILTEEQMIPILRDLHFAESTVQANKLHKDSADHQLAIYYKQIFELHQIDKEIFFKSFDYYKNNPDKFSDMYEELLEQMNEIEAKNRERDN